MSELDERIREAMERSTAPADPAGAFERVVRKRARRRTVRRAQMVSLTVAVVVVTSGVTFMLGRMFGSDRQEEAVETPPPPLAVPDIAFAGEVEGNPGIYVMRADGTDVKRVAEDSGRPIDPSWSPDGTKIAFESDRDGDFEIYVLDLVSGEERQVTDNPADDLNPAWSPDGGKLAFVSQRDAGSHLYTIDAGGDEAEGSSVTRLTSGASSNFDPAWSADGTQIYFARDPVDGTEHPGLYVLNVPSASHPDPPAPSRWLFRWEGNAYQPAVSPDGTRVAFVSDEGGVAQIWVAEAGSIGRQLTKDAAPKSNPSWSPDGKRIVFSAGTGMNALYVMNEDGTGRRKISEGSGDHVTPAWNPRSTAPPVPEQGSEGESRCLSEEEVAGDPSLRKPGSLTGDVDGDGLDDVVSVAIDPQTEEPTCRYFLVVQTGTATRATPIDLTYVEGTSDELLYIHSLAEINGQSGLEIFVHMQSGAATEFGQIYTMTGGLLTLMLATGPEPDPNALFSYAGSLSGISALDCGDRPGSLIVSGAYPGEDPEKWIVERSFYESKEPALLEPTGSTERHDVTLEEVSSGGLGRFPEFGEAPLDDCPGFRSAF